GAVDNAHDERAVEGQAGKGPPGGGDAAQNSRKLGVATLRKLARGEDAALGAAWRAFDQLGGGKGDRTASQDKRRALGNSFGSNVAVEESDGPKIKLRIRHWHALARCA